MTQRLKVRLTPDQIAYATRIGRQRHAEHGIDPRVDTSRDGVDLHIQGACAEMAVSVALKRPWDGAFQKLAEWRVWRKIGHDVGGLQVRCTSYTTGGLCVHKMDPDTHPFVLVLDRDAPEYVLAGWIMGMDAKKDMYWDETLMSKRPCYLVPQIDLRSCAELAREPERASGGAYRRDPAPDFAGHGKWPQMRYADDGGHPSKYGNIITSKFSLPCCRCQTIIEAGQPLGGNLVTGTIHGDPAMCKMKKRRASQ